MRAHEFPEWLRATHPLRTAQERRVNEQHQFRAYRSLSPAEGQALARHALTLWDTGEKSYAEEFFRRLTVWVPGAMQDLHWNLLQRNILYPPDLFRGADAGTRDALMKRAEAFTSDSVDQWVLIALAWIGDSEVRRACVRWREQPPVWRDSPYAPPEEFTEQAGWMLTPEGGRRDLYAQTCFALLHSNATEQDERQGAVAVVGPTRETCGWCNRALVALLDITTSRPELAFLGWPGARLRVAACETCTAFETTFTDVASDGGLRWSDANVRSEYLPPARDMWEPLPRAALRLGPSRANPYEANLFEVSEGISQLGGHPSWQQDAEYPRCPRCRQAMPFVGQVHLGDLAPYSEGTYYAFLCAACGVAATTYQRT